MVLPEAWLAAARLPLTCTVRRRVPLPRTHGRTRSLALRSSFAVIFSLSRNAPARSHDDVAAASRSSQHAALEKRRAAGPLTCLPVPRVRAGPL